jgi:peroxin-7
MANWLLEWLIGGTQVWDLSAPPQMNPLRSFEEHSHEVYAVAWNQTRRDCFLSASWDDTIKLWNLDSRVSLRTFVEHSYCIYAVTWWVHICNTFA